MGSKRSLAEVDAPARSHDGANKKRKQFKSHKPRASSGLAQPGQSLNEVKKRARDIERRFARGGQLPVDVQQGLQRELAHLKNQMEDLGHKKRRSDMISKYHKVRFFERQKAERLRKQLKKRLDRATEPEEKTKIQQDLHIVDVDWHYAKYHPFMERYISLYPAGKAKASEDDDNDEPTAKRALHSERPPLWKEIEAAIGEGQRALEAIQERRRPDETRADKLQKKKKNKNKFEGMDKGRREALGLREDGYGDKDGDGDEDAEEDADSGDESDFFA